MVSGALAGLLKVGAVALTAGGLATGIYLAVQVGEEEDANRAQTVGTPAVTSTALSPPNQVVRPTAKPTITPTYILAPSPTPPSGVDTSNWKTYTSPDGYSFKYPPDWTLQADEPSVVSPESARLAAEADGDSADRPGMAEFRVFFDAHEGFPVNAIKENCERPPELSLPTDRPDSASVVTFRGRRAVQCLQSGIDPTSRAEWIGIAYVVDLEPDQDRAMTVAARVVPQGGVNLATIEAIISTLAFGSPR